MILVLISLNVVFAFTGVTAKNKFEPTILNENVAKMPSELIVPYCDENTSRPLCVADISVIWVDVPLVTDIKYLIALINVISVVSNTCEGSRVVVTAL